MTSNQIVLRVIEALERYDVAYMLVGSYSSNAFGIARSTQDADFVIELGDKSPTPLFDDLKDVLTFDPQMRMETVTGTMRWVGKSADIAFSVELFLISHDPHDRERFHRRQKQSFLSTNAWLPTKEDVLIQKLRWFERARRAKDLDDVKSVLAVQGSNLDLQYLQKWCTEHGTADRLHQLMSEVNKSGQE